MHKAVAQARVNHKAYICKVLFMLKLCQGSDTQGSGHPALGPAPDSGYQNGRAPRSEVSPRAPYVYGVKYLTGHLWKPVGRGGEPK